MKRIRYLITFLTAIWFQTAFSSDIQILNDCAHGYCIKMSGKITRGDYDKALSIILYKKELPKNIIITSPGGDVVETIKLGMMIRRGLVRVSPAGTCNSACSFLVFASIDHHKLGHKIGLHRPYYEQEYFAGLSLQEANERYAELDKLVASYLNEMGVPTIISEKIMSIPSNTVEHISLGDYIEVAGRKPPAIDEWLIAQCGPINSHDKFSVRACQREAIAKEQEKIIKSLIKANPEKEFANSFTKYFGEYAESKAKIKDAAASEELRTYINKIELPPMKDNPRTPGL